jgi:hypothetical protein
MAYWEDLIAATLVTDLPLDPGDPAARGRMLTKLFTVHLRRGEPVDARELGELGAPSVVFSDPVRVFEDIAAGRLNPYRQVVDGRLKVADFAANFLFSKAPGRFYCGPLLYFRKDDTPPPAGARLLGATEWEAFKADVARGLPEPGPADAPYVDGLLMQRIINIQCRDGVITRASELPSGGDPPIRWEPADLVWRDLAAGALSPISYVQSHYREVDDMSIHLFYVKDREHIGYELGIR